MKNNKLEILQEAITFNFVERCVEMIYFPISAPNYGLSKLSEQIRELMQIHKDRLYVTFDRGR